MKRGEGSACQPLDIKTGPFACRFLHYNNLAIIWDVEGRQPLHRLKGHTAEIYGVAVTADGQRVVTGSDDDTLRLCRVADGGLIAELKGYKDKVRAVAISRFDGSIASGGVDGEIRL